MLEDLVELLERQWNFLLTQEGTAFHRQLRRFVRLVQEEPRLAALINDMRREGDELVSQHLRHDQDLTQRLVALKKEFIKQVPEEDDSAMAFPASGWSTLAYEASLANFDTIANSSRSRSIWVDTATDNTKSQKLLGILTGKFNKLEYTESQSQQPATRTIEQLSRIDELRHQLLYFQQQHQYAHRNFVDQKLTSPGLLFNGVLRLLRDFNREPAPLPADKQERDAQVLAQVNEYLNEGLMTPGKHHLEEALYEDRALSKDEREAVEHSTRALKLHMTRVYKDLRLRIGTRQSLLGLVSRFQHRCQWHDRTRLYNLAKGAKRRAEEVLTAELALWLFDQGLSPVSKPMMAGLQPDLTDPSFRFNLYVEAKQYNVGAKQYLIDGFHQLWDTVSGLKGTPYEVKEAFYVVFRRGGPRYILPDQPLPGEGWTAHLRLIDIAPTEERGSQGAKKPIVISEGELMPART
ncbi:hypothetical protein [Cystobacter fuscus]|uniref:hypothetical protein n=1 Tax=Cystobacter fuscus TaxID=43 RepID=UPI002B295B39|nr:hypothetical protein F0U63_27050 [Cystobacter fuscus]